MTFTTDRQATLLFDSIGDLLSQVPPDSARIGIRSPSLAPTHGSPKEGRLPHGLDAVTDDWELGAVRSVSGCCEILAEVADEWAEKLGYRGPDSSRVSVDWLADTCQHAYEQLDRETWDSAMSEAHRVWAIANHLAGRDPEPAGVSCPNDGTKLMRYVLDDGLSDWIICTECGNTFTPATAHNLAKIRASTAHVLVTQSEASKLLGISKATISSWIRRGHLDSHGVRKRIFVDETRALSMLAPLDT